MRRTCSYLPEAGEQLMLLQYLSTVLQFNPFDMAVFIAVVGVLSIIAQTAVLQGLLARLSDINVVRVGLAFGLIQMVLFSLSVRHARRSAHARTCAAL